jgi:hypothetical protein
MNCELAQQKLIDDLAHRYNEEVSAHLNSCADCQHLCDDLMSLEKLARSLGDQYKAPEGFGSEVLAHTSKRAFGSFFQFRPVLVPLAIVMLSFGFFWMNDGSSASDEPVVTGEAAVVDMADWEDADSAFIEVVIEDPAEGEMMLHLPSVIEIRRTELHEDFHYQNTSY